VLVRVQSGSHSLLGFVQNSSSCWKQRIEPWKDGVVELMWGTPKVLNSTRHFLSRAC
jgi:hypothetical protein